jgi:hypothetical protein
MGKYQATRLLASLGTADGRKWLAPDSVEVRGKEIVVRRWVKGDVRQREEVLTPSRIAQVRIQRGLRTSTLTLETTGGGAVSVPGLLNADAEAAAKEIRALLD